MPPPQTRWHVVNPAALVARHWPGEVEHVVFHSGTGDLHLLNSAAVAILERLSAGPASLDELTSSSDSPDPEPVRALLELLDRLGLIQPLVP